MLNYLLYAPQLLLIALYDWIFFANDYSSYPASCWWAFVLLHSTIIVEIVATCVLRHMKTMPLTKKHPMWLFSIIIGLQLVCATVFSLIQTIGLKWTIIFQSSIIGLELFSFGILYLIQRHREKSDPKFSNEIETDNNDGEYYEEDDSYKTPQKIKSSAMLLLMNFLSDPNNWNVPNGFEEINELTELASASTQYTYEELSAVESELKTQTNALKTYLHNESLSRAKTCVSIISDLLRKREDEIFDIENK